MNTVLPARRTVIRAAGAIAATLLISMLFVASYAGALHNPKPEGVPIAVAKQVPAAVSEQLGRGGVLKIEPVADARAAARAIDRREAYASITVDGSGRLVVTDAPAASAAVAQLVETQVVGQLRQAGQAPAIETAHALPAADGRGTVGFYLAIGWALAGYFGATLLGLALSTSIPRGRAAWRIVAIAVLGLLAGVIGTLIAGGIGDWPGGFLASSLLGLLTVLAIGTATMAFQTVLGLAGTGLAILVFVILGNPAAGGAAAPELLPGFWRSIGPLLPNGAAVTGLRDAVYFPAASLSGPILVLLVWFVVSAAAAILLSGRDRDLTPAEAEASLAGAAA